MLKLIDQAKEKYDKMETIFRICLMIVGLINFIPSILAVLPNKISQSYGIEIPDANYELLLRHRAVLFGIVGGLIIYSAISKKYYTLSVTIGLISMVSFLILFKLGNGAINAELEKVMNIDLVGIVILLVGYGLYKLTTK